MFVCVCSICDIHLKRKRQQALLVNTLQKNTCSTEGTARLRALPVPLGAAGAGGVCGGVSSPTTQGHREKQINKTMLSSSPH